MWATWRRRAGPRASSRKTSDMLHAGSGERSKPRATAAWWAASALSRDEGVNPLSTWPVRRILGRWDKA